MPATDANAELYLDPLINTVRYCLRRGCVIFTASNYLFVQLTTKFHTKQTNFFKPMEVQAITQMLFKYGK